MIQSCYVPWRGYFDFIASVDRFVIYDDAQYSRGSWRNRNRLKTADGLRWLTVPVRFAFGARIDEVLIGASTRGDWRVAHERQIEAALGPAPFFADALALWRAGVADAPERLTGLNEALLRRFCEYLGIDTPIVRSTDFGRQPAETSTGRLIALLRAVGATTYVSGPVARDYLEESGFREAGIALEYKRYAYAPYPQLWGDFEGAVSILDLVANCGPRSREHLRCLEANEVVTG